MKQKRLKFLLFVNLFSLTGFYCFSPLYALFAKSLAITPRSIGLIWGLYTLASAVFILLFGKYENKKSKAKLIILGFFIYALCDLLFLSVKSPTSLVIVLLFNALGAGITLPAYKTLFAKSEVRGRESEQWSWLDSSNMFAAATGSALGGVIVGIYDFRGLFIAMAIIQFMAALIAYLSLRNVKS
jgi:MFS family permease